MKTARIRLVFEYDVAIPDWMGASDVEFHRNEGSWCFDNSLDELRQLAGDGCLCNRGRVECLGIVESEKAK